MNEKYFAHSENDIGKKHNLANHLYETARIAESFVKNDEYQRIFRYAGLLHDLGKYQPDFQQYLLEGGKRGSVPHAAWGAGYARILRQLEISFVIDGHHKGLPNPDRWRNDTQEFIKNQNTDFPKTKDAFLKDIAIDINELDQKTTAFSTSFDRDLFIRFLFSALTDADWLDTEAHFNPQHTAARNTKELQIDTMIENLDSAIAQKAKCGEINTLRNQVRLEVLSKSEGSPGFYSLSLPTGMGKTLVSVAWALRHAKVNSQKRIIIVLPYINIIDQTSKILKELFGEEFILEHHSGFNEEALNDEMAFDSAEKKKRLACENWDYPVIVTTTVQFFESLFSNKPSKCRKIHNIADSVVIFDEVQSLPKEIILPTLTMLKNVQSLMNSSFLFCTATMPAFEKREGFDGIDKIEPLIENPESIYNKTRRVDYRLLKDLQPVNLDVLTGEMRDNNCSVLCIFNTKKAAKDAYEKIAVNNSTWDHIYHLSTGMCSIHRKSVIKEIIGDLENRRKILVTSTQLIEAGVDFDFPCVFREIAPLESIIQSAGRCNREGKLPENGKVLLFKLLDGGMPDQAYRTYAEFAIGLISQDLDQLYRYDFFKGYYQKIIKLFANPDKFNINELRKNLEFETVNDCYHLIGKPTESLFVYRYNDESNKLFNEIKGKPFLSRDDYRKIQVYSVQVYKSFLIKNAHFCSTTPLGLLIWNGNYEKNTGISTQLMSPDECIV
jgi:CRISPR-associated endonuclease/helicase Cas3